MYSRYRLAGLAHEPHYYHLIRTPVGRALVSLGPGVHTPQLGKNPLLSYVALFQLLISFQMRKVRSLDVESGAGI